MLLIIVILFTTDNKVGKGKHTFISTTRELSVNRIDLQAPALMGPPQTTQGDGTPSCTIPRQSTINI